MGKFIKAKNSSNSWGTTVLIKNCRHCGKEIDIINEPYVEWRLKDTVSKAFKASLFYCSRECFFYEEGGLL